LRKRWKSARKSDIGRVVKELRARLEAEIKGINMRTVQHCHGLGKRQLQAMAEAHDNLDDMEFLETLAQRRCMVMPPWVYHIKNDGHLEKVTPVRYDQEYNLDKPQILLAVMDKVHARA
jgi:hypothetical protein